MLVESHERIARHYLTRGFPSTLSLYSSLLPSIFISRTQVARIRHYQILEQINSLQMLPSCACYASCACSSLLRLARASRIIKRWRAKITLSNGTLTLLQCCCELFIATHWYAFFSLRAAMAGEHRDTWLGSSMFAYCESEVYAVAIHPAFERASPRGHLCLSVGSWYLAAFSWSIMVITGTGGTGLWPSRRNDTRRRSSLSLW